MAEAEAEDEVTGDELMMTWQFTKAVIMFKRNIWTAEEAVEHMCVFTELSPAICQRLLRDLVKEKYATLEAAFPKLGYLPTPEESRPGAAHFARQRKLRKLRGRTSAGAARES